MMVLLAAQMHDAMFDWKWRIAGHRRGNLQGIDR